MTEETAEVVETTETTEAPVVENALSEAPETPETPVEPETPTEEPTAEEKEHGNKGKKPWYMKEIDDLRYKAAQAREQAENAQALLEKMGTKETEPKASDQDIDRLVEARAAARQMQRDREDLINAGNNAFGAEVFNNAAGIAATAGCVSDDFVSDVIAVDRANAHEIYMKLAEDPERAHALGRMDSRRRISELTRMADAIAKEKTTKTSPLAAKPAPKQVSKAPAPPPPVEPTTAKIVDWRNADSEEDFQRGWEENMKKRSTRR